MPQPSSWSGLTLTSPDGDIHIQSLARAEDTRHQRAEDMENYWEDRMVDFVDREHYLLDKDKEYYLVDEMGCYLADKGHH